MYMLSNLALKNADNGNLLLETSVNYMDEHAGGLYGAIAEGFTNDEDQFSGVVESYSDRVAKTLYPELRED